MIEHVEHPFEPVFSPESKVLILGSLPSVRSRAEGFYYGHPRNRFWPVLAGILGEPVPADNEGRRAMILRHGLALWDVIAACDIAGSSDASVRDAVPVDIRRIMGAAPVERIICNGALAGKLYRQHLQPITGVEAIVLPSTSPANAAWSQERLAKAWAKHILPAE